MLMVKGREKEQGACSQFMVRETDEKNGKGVINQSTKKGSNQLSQGAVQTTLP